MDNLALDKRFKPKDVVAFFLNTEFIYFDFKTDQWQNGGIVSLQGDHNPVLMIPENTAIIRVDDKVP